eukprot:5970481-Prymnesium_polylepis.1
MEVEAQVGSPLSPLQPGRVLRRRPEVRARTRASGTRQPGSRPLALVKAYRRHPMCSPQLLRLQ